jgi:TonB family protein
MPFLAVMLAAALSQAANLSTDCAAALARATSTVAAQVCLGEEQFLAAQAATKGSAEWTRRLRAATDFYRRAKGLAADDGVKTAVIERLLILLDEPLLNDPRELEAAFLELIQVNPTELDPLFRFARFQERQGAIDAAEETLLSARRLQPGDIEPFRRLAQFYARRVTALHMQTVKEKPAEERPSPGAPDKNGVYQLGGALTPPRRLGNAKYPPDANAAGIQGAVVAEITVNELGIVTDARVLRSVPMLDEAALQAVGEWRYDPTIVDGKPVPVKMEVTVNFSQSR